MRMFQIKTQIPIPLPGEYGCQCVRADQLRAGWLSLHLNMWRQCWSGAAQ